MPRMTPAPSVPTLLIVWHSRTGAARQMAEAAARGAHAAAQTMDTALQVQLCPAAQADAARLRNAQGYVFCAPENLGSLSGEMKDFFDRNYYALLDAIAGRPYGLLVAAGTDGEGACRQFTRIITGWRLREVVPAFIHRNGAQTPEAILGPKHVPAAELARCEESGGTVAATLLL